MAERTSALTAGGHKSICVYDGQLNLLARLESWVSRNWSSTPALRTSALPRPERSR